MSSIIIPRKWTQQPQYPVDVNRSAPYGASIEVAINLTPALIESAKKVRATVSGTTKFSGNRNGYGFENDQNSYVGVDTGADWSTFSGYTVIIIGTFGNYDSYGALYAKQSTSGNNSAQLQIQNSNVIAVQHAAAGNANFTSAGPFSPATIQASRFVAISWDGQNVRGYLDGALKETVSYTTAVGSGVAALKIGAARDASTLAVAGVYNACFVFSKALPSAYIAELAANPWQLFRKQPQVLYFDVGGGATTGTGALTTGATTASGTGTLSHTGTGALTSGAITASGTGTLTHTGTGALTTLAATLAGAGVLTHVGTGDLTTAAVTVSGSGTVTQAGAVTGTGALTISAITASGAGVISHTGTGSLQTSVVTLAGAGVLTHTGTGDLTTGTTTVAGTGTVLGQITGTGALTIGAVTVYGYDVLPVAERPAGGGGTSSTTSGKRRQKLILVDRIEEVEELLEQVEEIVQQSPKRKAEKKAKKPTQTVQEAPQAAFDWIGYYQAQLDRLRDQQRAISLKRQLDKNAEIIRAIIDRQQQEAQIAQQLQIQRDEEDFMLLLMAA